MPATSASWPAPEAPLYANRQGHIWTQEDANRHTVNGDMTGNIIEDNQIAGIAPRAVGYLLTTRFASTAAFGRFDRNRFFDRMSATVAFTSSMAGAQAYTLANWRGATGAGSLSPADLQATGTSLRGLANCLMDALHKPRATMVATEGLS